MAATKFAFEADVWSTAFGANQFCLTRVFRQSDQSFVSLLNELRVGRAESRLRAVSRDRLPPGARVGEVLGAKLGDTDGAAIGLGTSCVHSTRTEP